MKCQIRLKVTRSVMRISSLRYDNSRRRFSEVQENVVSTLSRKILTCVVLVGWLNVLSRGI